MASSSAVPNSFASNMTQLIRRTQYVYVFVYARLENNIRYSYTFDYLRIILALFLQVMALTPAASQQAFFWPPEYRRPSRARCRTT
jgi:hypothetical protein